MLTLTLTLTLITAFMRPRIAITLELSQKGSRRLSFLDLAYAECVREAGGIPFHFPPIPSPDSLKDVLPLMDGLVLTGGADIPPSFYGEEISFPLSLSPEQRTRFDLELFRAALQAGKAILAICHGMQIVNVALGGTLFQDLPSQVPKVLAHRGDGDSTPARHAVLVEPESKLYGIVGGKPGIEVSSSHHQAVKKLGQGLRVSARAPDGVVEGVEMPGRQSFWGVQWHPEKDPGSEPTRLLFAALVQMARLEGRAPMGGK